MLGNKVLNRKIKVTEAAALKYDEVVSCMDELCEISGINWDMISRSCLNRVRRKCFAEGIIVGGAITICAWYYLYTTKEKGSAEKSHR